MKKISTYYLLSQNPTNDLQRESFGVNSIRGEEASLYINSCAYIHCPLSILWLWICNTIEQI